MTYKPTPEPGVNFRPVKLIFATLAALLVFAIGFTAGDSTDNRPALQTSTPRPTTTVTSIVPASTPDACLSALTYGETGFGLASQAMTAAGNAATAIGEGRFEDAAEAQAQLEAVTEKLTALAPKWNTTKAECRAAS